MRDYQKEVVSYTRGLGRLFCSLKGYEPCKNQEEIVEQIGYDSERDLDNPTGSVFCAHGAGFVVPWYQVEEYMHLDTGISEEFDDLSAEGRLAEHRKRRRKCSIRRCRQPIGKSGPRCQPDFRKIRLPATKVRLSRQL